MKLFESLYKKIKEHREKREHLKELDYIFSQSYENLKSQGLINFVYIDDETGEERTVKVQDSEG